MSEIWNKVYGKDASFFGDDPSNLTLACYEEFKKHGVKQILELGSGQGRDIILSASSLLSAVFGLIFAAVFLREPIGIYQLIAVIIMLIGVYLMYKNEPKIEAKR